MNSTRARRLAIKIGLGLVALDFALALAPQFSRSSLTSNAAEILPTHGQVLLRSTDFDKISSIKTPRRDETKTAKKPNLADPTPMTNEQRDLCRIKNSSTIPLDGDVKLQSVERLEGGRYYWLKSSNCPDELYSIVSVDAEGRIDKEINCQNTSLTELVLNSGLQFTVDVAAPDPKVRSMAISGEGRFLVNCPDSGLTLTRDGRFNQERGPLVSSEGCVAWTRKDGGRPVRFAHEESLDTNGCSLATGECLEILGTDERDVDAFNFKTKNSLSILNERGLKSLQRIYVFSDSFEDLDSADRSLTGVEDWEKLKTTTIPTSCPN